MAKRKQTPLNWNVEDKRDMELYNWLSQQSDNVSGFVKDILFQYMEKKLEQEHVKRLHEIMMAQAAETQPQPLHQEEQEVQHGRNQNTA